eukprot:TRINITY_DN564_c0_g1_i5.p1 TRINITY_DN564_c0_g1~~TRINITY_DN564_c0_g1_i5.p1  ORF type:complete len:115 (+),score=17.70 TRINITY_DN564_c0_g1_i5:169-513(+)
MDAVLFAHIFDPILSLKILRHGFPEREREIIVGLFSNPTITFIAPSSETRFRSKSMCLKLLSAPNIRIKLSTPESLITFPAFDKGHEYNRGNQGMSFDVQSDSTLVCHHSSISS